MPYRLSSTAQKMSWTLCGFFLLFPTLKAQVFDSFQSDMPIQNGIQILPGTTIGEPATLGPQSGVPIISGQQFNQGVPPQGFQQNFPQQGIPAERIIDQQRQVTPANPVVPFEGAPQSQLPKEVKDVEQTLVRAKKLLQKYQESLKTTIAKNMELQEKIRILESKVANPAPMQPGPDQAREIEIAQKAAEEAATRATELNKRLNTALAELNRKSTSLEHQKQTVDDLRLEIKKLRESASMAGNDTHQLTDLESKLKVAMAERESLIEKRDALKTQMTKLNDENTRLSQRLSQLEKRAMSDSKENQSLTLQLNKLKAEGTNGMQDAVASAKIQQQLQDEIARLEDSNKSLSNQLIDARGLNTQLESELRTLATQNQKMPEPANNSSELEALQIQLGNFQQQNDQLTAQINTAQSSLRLANNENTRLQSQHRLLNRKTAKAETAREPITEKVTRNPLLTPAPVVAPAPVEAKTPSVLAAVAETQPEQKRTLIWPVKYWLLGLMLIGLTVGLLTAWLESDPRATYAKSEADRERRSEDGR